MPVQNQYIIFLGLNAYFWKILKNLGKLIFQGQISMGKFTQSLLSKVFCLFSRLPSLFPLPVVMFLRPAWSGHWLSPGHRSRSCIRGLSGAGARGKREWTLMSNINQGLKPEPQPRPQNGSMGTHLKLRTQAGYVKSFYSWNKSPIHMYLAGPSDDALNPNHVVNCESTSLPSGVRCVPPNSHTETTYTGWAEVLPLNQYYKISS